MSDALNRTHKVYGHVTEDEFYAGLNEAKKENILVDEKGWVDIGELIHEMWTAFADGRMAIVPKEGFHRPEKKTIEHTDVELIEEIPKKPTRKRATKAKESIEVHEDVVQEA